MTPAGSARYFAAGDFNHDGITDLAVGADGKTISGVPLAGAVYVLAGSVTGLTTTGSKLWSFATPYVRGNPVTLDNFGDCLTAGDFNGDGYTDLAITVDKRELGHTPGIDHGVVLVFSGSRTSLITADRGKYKGFSELTRGIRSGGAGSGDEFGSMVKTADFNHDGYADLMIAAAGKTVSGQQHAGMVYYLRGSSRGVTSGDSRAYSQATPGIEGSPQADAYFGGT